MKMKKIILPAFIVTSLLLGISYGTHTHAQTPVVSSNSSTLTPTPKTVKSDFEVDLEEGEKANTTDPEAKRIQNEQKDNEQVGVNEQGEIENELEEIDKQDTQQLSDDLNQEEGENDKDSVKKKDKEEGEKLDDKQSGTKSTTGTQSGNSQQSTDKEKDQTSNGNEQKKTDE